MDLLANIAVAVRMGTLVKWSGPTPQWLARTRNLAFRAVRDCTA